MYNILNCKLSLDLQNVRPSVLPSCSFYRILPISHTGHHYNVAGVMKEFIFFQVIFGSFQPFLGKKRPKNQNSLNSFNIARRTSLQYRERHQRKNFMIGSFSGRFQPFLG